MEVAAATTTFDKTTDVFTVTWDKPNDNGNQITEYKVFVANKAATEYKKVTCESSSSGNQCLINLATLKQSEWNLAFGD